MSGNGRHALTIGRGSSITSRVLATSAGKSPLSGVSLLSTNSLHQCTMPTRSCYRVCWANMARRWSSTRSNFAIVRKTSSRTRSSSSCGNARGRKTPSAGCIAWFETAPSSASRTAARRTRHETCIASRCNIWFEPSTDDVLDSKTVIAALDSLRPELREVIVLRIWGQQSFDQIAAVIDKSISTAHRRYETAIETLQQRLCAKPEGAMQ